MAAGGYTTRRELLNGASGVSNGYRYRAESAKMYLWVPDLLLVLNVPKFKIAANRGWSEDTCSELIFFKNNHDPEVYLTGWRVCAR